MSILNNYLTSRIFKGYLLVCVTFIMLYIIVDLFSHFSTFLQKHISFSIIAAYYLYSLPSIFLTVSPFSLLISIVYTFAELNRHNEILGMRALGSSVSRLAFPALACALLLSAVSLFIQEKTLLDYQTRAEHIKLHYIKKDAPLSDKKIKNLAFCYKNMTFFIQTFVPQEQSLYEVVIFKENAEGNIVEKLIAHKITYSEKVWKAYDLTSYSMDSEGGFLEQPTYWTDKEVPLQETPESLTVKKSLSGDFAPIEHLKKEIALLKQSHNAQQLRDRVIKLHKNIAAPFTHLFLIIGVLPFALEIKKRKVGLTSLAIGFIFGFIYYAIFAISIPLGGAEIILPFLCVWIAPLFFLVMGISGLYFIR